LRFLGDLLDGSTKLKLSDAVIELFLLSFFLFFFPSIEVTLSLTSILSLVLQLTSSYGKQSSTFEFVPAKSFPVPIVVW